MNNMNKTIPERMLLQKRKQEMQRSNKAVAYVRVSDDGQIDGESLDTQRNRIQKYADDNDIEIVKWFGDEGISGKTVRKRTDMLELLKYCAKNKGDVGYVIFYKMWRASRDAPSYYAEIDTVLHGLGIVVRSASEYIDETPTGRFIKGVLVLNGQLDNEIKSGTTSDNMEGVARQGWWQQGFLVGYELKRISIAPKKKRLTLCRGKDSDKVAALFKAFAKGGLTQADIVRMAKEANLRNYKGKYMDDNAVYRMLTQPAYAGYICNKLTNYEMYEGKHFKEAIIDLETFEQVQRVISSQSRKRLGKTVKVTNELYPLRRFLLCFNCQKPYYASAPKTGGGKSHSPRYHCSRISCRGIVSSIDATKANNEFAKLLTKIKPTGPTLRLYKEILNRTALKQLESINSRVKLLRNAISSIDEERTTAMRRNNIGELSNKEKDELILALDTDKLDKSDQLDKLQEQQRLKQAQIDYAMNFMHDAHKLWGDADVDLRVRFQKMIFPEGVLLDTKTLDFGTTKISPLCRYIPNKKDLSAKEKSLVVTPAGFEPAIAGLRTRSPGPLDEGAVTNYPAQD
jgi:site-specific DNA recombinase